MKLAYLILAHRYPDQLIRLVDRLDHAAVTFLIHLDKKMDTSVSEQIERNLGKRGNVIFIRRHICHWGGFGIVKATMQGIIEAIEREIQFDYLALLSGQDYPIKTNEHILGFLSKKNGTSYIHINPFPYNEWSFHQGGFSRVERWHFRNEKYYIVFPQKNMLKTPLLNKFWNLLVAAFPLKRTFPKGYHPYGGAQFWCLHKQYVQYVYRFIKEHPQFVRFFRYVYVPDEIFFQTIIGNMEDKSKIHSDTLTFLEWHRPGAVLDLSDFQSLKDTNHLFARKFDYSIDAAILDLVDKEILRVSESTYKK